MMVSDHQQSDIALHMEYENHYTVSEFALIMHMHPQTIRRAIKVGRIIAFRVGISKKATYRIAEVRLIDLRQWDLMRLVDFIKDV